MFESDFVEVVGVTVTQTKFKHSPLHLSHLDSLILHFDVDLQKCMLSLFLEVKQVKLEGLVSTHFTLMNSQLSFYSVK